GRAIGLIFMGISGSLVFGVPLGVQISDWFGWRWIFAGIAVYSLPLCLLLWRYLPQVAFAAGQVAGLALRQVAPEQQAQGQRIDRDAGEDPAPA
ncbi:MFS transporter, partial [Pseudomonas aeruginosa]